MILRTYSCGPVSTNAYLLGCDQTRSAILIDAPKNCSSLIIKDLESLGLRLEGLIFTHSHWDHIADGAYIQKKLLA